MAVTPVGTAYDLAQVATGHDLQGEKVDRAEKVVSLGVDAATGKAASLLVGGVVTVAEKSVGHHTVPRAILRILRPSVRNHPDVKGGAGKPNIESVLESVHRDIHSSPPGDYYPGGEYNRKARELLDEHGGRGASVDAIKEIREQLKREFPEMGLTTGDKK